MKKDKIKFFILELLLITLLFFALFASNIFTREVLAIIMPIYLLIVYYFLKYRKDNSIYKRQITIWMLIFSLIYLCIFYLIGLYFGFVTSKFLFSTWTILKFIIPLTIIIISTEIMRKIFLSREVYLDIKGKKINLALILTYIFTVLADLVIYTGIYKFNNLDNFLTILGFVLFASLSCNLLYNYISSRYGSLGIVIYRLITTLYIYIIPITPDIYIFFQSFLRMVYPFLIYLVLEKIYSKNDFAIAYNDKKKEIIGNTILFVIAILFIMLISCEFKYGILVIGSESMTGSLNKGDAVIFESYNNQLIEKGQIIIFDYNGIQTIHRVIDAKDVNGTIRYYTKGDANKNIDNGYITDNEIQGLVKLKIKYIGYPTIWVRKLFS